MDGQYLETARLVLRAPTSDDLPDVHAIHADPVTNQHNPQGPIRSLDEARSMLDAWLTAWRDQGYGYWAVATRSEPAAIIGFGGVSPKMVSGAVRPNLYFRFHPSTWGQGYAAEMAREALRFGCQASAAGEIVATVRPDNAPSIRLLERLGLLYSGDITDDYGPSRLYIYRCA